MTHVNFIKINLAVLKKKRFILENNLIQTSNLIFSKAEFLNSKTHIIHIPVNFQPIDIFFEKSSAFKINIRLEVGTTIHFIDHIKIIVSKP